MAAIILPQPWNRQPQFPVGINREHPFAGALVHAYLFSIGGYRNVADVQYTTSVQTAPARTVVNGSIGLSFNGTTDGLVVSAIPFSNEFTWAGRIFLPSTVEISVYGSIAAHHTTNGNPSDWALYWSPVDSKFHVDIPWVAGDVLISTNTYSTGIPYSVMLTRTGSSGSWTYNLYVNGVLDKSSTTASNPNTGAQNYALGCIVPIVNGNHASTKYEYSYLFNKAIGISGAQEFNGNPWQVFAPLPRRLFVGPSAGGASTITATATLDAAIQAAQTATATLDAAIQATQTTTTTLDGVIAVQNTATVTLDAAIQQALTATTTLDAAIQATMSATSTLDAVIQNPGVNTYTLTATLDAAIREAKTLTATLDAAIQIANTSTVTLDAVIVSVNTATATLDATIQSAATAYALLDAYIFDADAPVVVPDTTQTPAGKSKKTRDSRRRYVMPDDTIIMATPDEAEQLVKLFVKPKPQKKTPKRVVKTLRKVDLVDFEPVSSDTVETAKIVVKPRKAVWESDSTVYEKAIQLFVEREQKRRRYEEELILLYA